MKTSGLTFVLLAFGAAAYAQPCAREELKAAAESYFDAIVKRDPRPFWDVPITENGKRIERGAGFFQTGGPIHFSRQVIDAERCGILTWGVIDETIDGATAPILFAARVRVATGKIARVETILHRKEERYFNPQAFMETAKQPAADGSCRRWEGGVRTDCPAAIPGEPTLADSETGDFAIATETSVEIFERREGRIERIYALFGTH